MYPNPTNGIVTIDDWYIKSIGYSVNVIDAQGKIIISQQNENKLDLSSFDSGVYFVSIQTADGMLINKRVSLVK